MPRLETPRLLLRPLQASDVAVLVAIWADPDVTRYMGGPRDGEKVRQTLEDELRTYSTDRLGFCPVVEKASGHIIGDCGLTKKDVDGRDEIGLVDVPDLRRIGGFVVPNIWANRGRRTRHLLDRTAPG